MNKIILSVILALLIMTMLLSCGQNQEKEVPKDKVRLTVSILPMEYFARRIGGVYVDIVTLVGPGQSPATYEPSARQMTALSEADVLFTIGVPFETILLPKIESMFPELRVISTHAYIKRRQMDSEHKHCGHDVHDDVLDPHVWLDPKLVIDIGQVMLEELIKLDPGHKEYYTNNFAALKNDLIMVDSAINEKLAPYKGKAFYVMHPAFGYFAETYGLIQKSVEIEGKEPNARELTDLIIHMKEDKATVILVQEQFSTASAERLAGEVNAVVLTVDPLAYQYVDNLLALADAIAFGFGN